MVGGNIDTNIILVGVHCPHSARGLACIFYWVFTMVLAVVTIMLCRSEREALRAQSWWGREIRIHVKSLGSAPVCCTHATAAAAGDKRGGVVVVTETVVTEMVTVVIMTEMVVLMLLTVVVTMMV